MATSSGTARAKTLPQAPRASQSSTPSLKATHTEELVFALCGPIGSPLREVAGTLDALLKDRFGYEVRVVRLSSVIEELSDGAVSTEPFARIRDLIDKGNTLRARFGPSVLADVAIREIAAEREERRPKTDSVFRPARVCHIIDSSKIEA